MEQEIINKVSQSALETVDLESYFPTAEIKIFDLKPYLFMDLILKEKDFRSALQSTDWTVFEGKIVGVTCSADAIIPVWAYMLTASYLQPLAKDVFMGNEEEIQKELLLIKLRQEDFSSFKNKRVVIKGCGEKGIGAFAYLEITKILRPLVKSIMYGEPCSTVPVYKSKG